MSRTPPERVAAVVLSLTLVVMPLPAAAQEAETFSGCLSNPSSPFIDNRDGFFVNYEEAPNHPLELSWDGRRLYATNLPDSLPQGVASAP